MSGYRYMSLAAKRDHQARGSSRHLGNAYRPEPRYSPALVECRRCRARVRAEEAAAHTARCAGVPLK